MMLKAIKEILGLLWAFVIAIVIQTFLFQPFYVPSASMYPTLEVGDFFVASKFSYGYSPYSLPWFHPPIFKGRIFEQYPTVGQVLAFNDAAQDGNPNGTDDYIKRCVGLPGDRIQMRKGVLHINGVPVKLERIADYLLIDPRHPGDVKVMPQFIETLPNGVTHKILKDKPFGEGRLDETQEFIVPPGHFFMMGDNRDHSSDSRDMNPIGFVPAERLIGPAKMIWFSTEAKWYEPARWLSGLRLGRFFSWIR
jgi:signal peptidase I